MDDEQFTEIRNQCVVWSFNYYRGATCPRTSLELLEKLADDEDRYVRFCVSENPNCPEYIKKFIEARNYMEKHYEQD